MPTDKGPSLEHSRSLEALRDRHTALQAELAELEAQIALMEKKIKNEQVSKGIEKVRETREPYVLPFVEKIQALAEGDLKNAQAVHDALTDFMQSMEAILADYDFKVNKTVTFSYDATEPEDITAYITRPDGETKKLTFGLKFAFDYDWEGTSLKHHTVKKIVFDPEQCAKELEELFDDYYFG